MSSTSNNDGKVVPFPGRHASHPLVPGLPGIEPDALYVFKLGPLETEEGRLFAYVALRGDGTALMPELAASDARGLARLAPLFQRRRLYCEPRLVRAGVPYGFVARPVPPELFLARAVMALSTEWGPLASETPSEISPQLLEAANNLWRAHPWELWTNIEVLELRLEGGTDPVWRELCVLGHGGEEFGFVVYSQPGSVERLGRLTEEERIQASLHMESLALLFEEEPGWVRTEVRRVTGLPVFPVPLRLSGGDFPPLRGEDLLTLLAVTHALTRLSPEQLEVREEVSLGGLHVTAHVRAHVPLFTSRRPPPSTPPSPTRPPSPSRKISQTLISFVQALIPEPEEVDPDGFVTMLELAITTWNAVVLDTWEPGRDRVGAVRAAVQALPGDVRQGMLPFFEALVERKRSDFQEDLRLMGGLQVRWAADGEPRIRLQWRLPGT
ncbi:DUF7309 domain-containing protein [Archangium sp.]|uniref:DUF7309 domain-containing protein n=1 Tax=Archangium sp. TaxID=1872627 RepID=UPI002D67790A|nr:hypothetical protein [Archangium sp.]HYO56544.1 hypothetical protein [Archangium sp.]